MPGAASIHASSAREALVKLAALPLLAGRNIDAGFVVPAVASCVHLVVHCVRDADGSRRVGEIVAPTGEVSEGRVIARTVYGGPAEAARPPGMPGEQAPHSAGLGAPAPLYRRSAG